MDITPTELSLRAKISPSYAWEILNGKRTPSLTMALRIFDALGCKLGPLAGLDDSEIATVRKMERAV